MSGPLPHVGRPGLCLQLLPQDGFNFLLLPWGKGQGSGLGQPRQDQEEGKPVYPREKCQAQGGLPEKRQNPVPVLVSTSVTFVETVSNLKLVSSYTRGKLTKMKSFQKIIRSSDNVKSKPVSPMKDEREELPNLQIFDCDACGEKFEMQDGLTTHMVTIEWCPCCKELSCNSLTSSTRLQQPVEAAPDLGHLSFNDSMG